MIDAKIDSKLAKEIHDRFLINSYEEGGDRAAFYAILDSHPQHKGSDIPEADRLFEKKLLPKKSGNLRKIKDTVCSYLSWVYIVLGEEDDLYLLFESLNAKGRSLTQADLIRNYFFM
ncbi:MAG: GmrSD restriction endonuclease domain-containing protein [Pseudanabaenaceae cyanobacterium]